MDTKINWFLYFSVATVNLYSITIGMFSTWSSPVIPKLLSNDTSINPLGKPITSLQISILTTLLPFGGIIGLLAFGKLPDIIGRKTTLRYLSSSTAIAFFGTFFGTNIYVFYVCLTIGAITGLGAIVVISNYVTEIAANHNRGKLGSLTTISTSLGQFLCYLIGPLVSVNVLGIICGSPALVVAILSVLLPESPVYLASKHKQIDVINVLKKLKRQDSFSRLNEDCDERTHLLQNNTENRKNNNFKNIFESRAMKRAFIISIGLKVLQASSGMYIVLGFLAIIFDEIGTTLSGETLAIILAAGKIIAAGVSLKLIEKFGRRSLILIFSFTCGASMFGFGLYLYFKNNNFDIPVSVSVLPVSCVIIYVISFTFGLSALPAIVCSEILPYEYRSIGSVIAHLIGTFCLMAGSFAFPLVISYLGMHYCMFAFSLCNFIGFVFIFVTLPETKDKSFSEIRNILNE